MSMIRCAACGYQIPVSTFATAKEAPCPLCRRLLHATVLPAVTRSGVTPPSLPEDPPGPGEATCFYNSKRRATQSCNHCGVFISDAWAAKWGSEAVCLKCLDNLRSKHQDSRFMVRRTLWDNIALGTAALPFLLCIPLLLLGPVGIPFMALSIMLSIITAPTALGLSLYAWKKPRSLVPRGPWRVISAILLSLAQCVAWGLIFFAGMSNRLFN